MDNTSGCSATWSDDTLDAVWMVNGSNIQIHNHTASTTSAWNPTTTGNCNESSKFDNDEKALYHGLKSAYRLSRTSDGEYGTTGDPPYETAARIAAYVCIGFLETTDQTYTREASFRYIEEEFAEPIGTIAKHFSDPPLDSRIGETEFSEAIAHAWTQIDTKRNHYNAARTALAVADLFLGGELDRLVQEISDG